jgi:hypothetical protein
VGRLELAQADGEFETVLGVRGHGEGLLLETLKDWSSAKKGKGSKSRLWANQFCDLEASRKK